MAESRRLRLSGLTTAALAGALVFSGLVATSSRAPIERPDEMEDPLGRVWIQEDCPTGGRTDGAYFAPRLPVPGDVLDIDPGDDWRGYEVAHVADIQLPEGVVLESGGEYLGSEGVPVEIGAAGAYGYYFLLSGYGEDPGRPALAQLVLDSASEPVRWEDDVRFGFVTDGGMGYLGSPSAEPLPSDHPFDEEAFWWFLGLESLDPCFQYRNDQGANFVIFENGYGDGFFPGAAGYDSRGRLVAITWFFGWESWVLAGIPGELPAPVAEMVACRERLMDQGVAYADTAWCPEDDG